MFQTRKSLQGMLDYVDNLTLVQVRNLLLMLSEQACAASKDNNENLFGEDEVHMLIRKQLASNRIKYKRIGIIGAVMVVRSLGCLGTSGCQDKIFSQDSAKSMSSPAFKQVNAYL